MPAIGAEEPDSGNESPGVDDSAHFRRAMENRKRALDRGDDGGNFSDDSDVMPIIYGSILNVFVGL